MGRPWATSSGKVQIQLPFKYLHFATQSSVIMCTMAATRMPLESQQRGERGRVDRGRGLAATPNGRLTIKNAATATEGALSTVAANVARPGRRPAVAAAASSGRNNNNYDVNFYRLLSLSLSLLLLPSHCPLSKQLQNKAQHQAGCPLYVCVCWGRIKIPNKPISKQNLLQRWPLSSVLCPSTIRSNPWFGNFFNASS